jgi:acyl carrier protein
VSTAQLARMGVMGIKALTSEEGLQLLDLACDSVDPLTIALRLDFGVLREQAREGFLLPLLRDLVQASVRHVSDGSGGVLAARLAGVPEHEHQEVVLGFLREQVAAVLGHSSPEDVDVDLTFKELGFDSLGVVYLRNRLNATTGLKLPATLVFNYPTTVALAAHLHDQVSAAGPGGGSLDEGVRQLREALLARRLDYGERMQIASRLRAVAAELQGGEGEDDESDVVERIESATATELFEMYESEWASDTAPDADRQSAYEHGETQRPGKSHNEAERSNDA